MARLRCAAIFGRVRGVFRVPDRRRHALAGRRRFSERLAALRRHERRRARRRRRSAGREPRGDRLADRVGYVSTRHRRALCRTPDLRGRRAFHPERPERAARCSAGRESRGPSGSALRRRHVRDGGDFADRGRPDVRTRPRAREPSLLRRGRRNVRERHVLGAPRHPDERGLPRLHGCDGRRSARLRGRVPRRRPREPYLGVLVSGPGQRQRGNDCLGRRLRRADRAPSAAHIHHPGDEPVASDRERLVLESRARLEPDDPRVSAGERNRGVDERLRRRRDSRHICERDPRLHRLGW